jgi:hypothetical protein
VKSSRLAMTTILTPRLRRWSLGERQGAGQLCFSGLMQT